MEQGKMKKAAGAAGLVVALAGIIGGVAIAQNQPKAETPMVVVPAAEPVAQTGTPTPTVAASPSNVPVVKAVTPAKTTAPKPVAAKPAPVKAAPVKVAAPVREAAPVSSKKTTVKKAASTSVRSLTVATDPAPVDSQPKPTPAPDDPIRQTPPPPIMGNYTGGPVQPKEVVPPPPAD